jgi:hypothetical protein
MAKALVSVSGGVADVIGGDVTIIDFDDWNDEDTTDERRQEMIESVAAAGYRAVVYSAAGERWNMQIFAPNQNYSQFISDYVRDDQSFTVYDPADD